MLLLREVHQLLVGQLFFLEIFNLVWIRHHLEVIGLRNLEIRILRIIDHHLADLGTDRNRFGRHLIEIWEPSADFPIDLEILKIIDTQPPAPNLVEVHGLGWQSRILTQITVIRYTLDLGLNPNTTRDTRAPIQLHNRIPRFRPPYDLAGYHRSITRVRMDALANHQNPVRT